MSTLPVSPVLGKAEFRAKTLALYRVEGVAGLLLQRDETVIANHLPFPDRQSGEIALLVRNMCAGYATVGRTIRQVLFAYDAFNLFVTSRGSVHLTLLVSPDAELDILAEAVSAFLDGHKSLLQSIGPATSKIELPAPDRSTLDHVVETIPVWPAVHKCLEAVLSKAMSHAQISGLIERTLKASRVTDTNRLCMSDARRIAIESLSVVPNRATRQSLIAELENALDMIKADA